MRKRTLNKFTFMYLGQLFNAFKSSHRWSVSVLLLTCIPTITGLNLLSRLCVTTVNKLFLYVSFGIAISWEVKGKSCNRLIAHVELFCVTKKEENEHLLYNTVSCLTVSVLSGSYYKESKGQLCKFSGTLHSAK